MQFLDKNRQKAHEKRLQGKTKEAEEKQAQPKTLQKQPKEVAAAANRRAPAAKRRLLEDRQDVSDFASEYTLLKKLKKGKLTEVIIPAHIYILPLIISRPVCTAYLLALHLGVSL